MKLFDLERNSPVETIEMPADAEFDANYVAARKPVILDNVVKRMPFVKHWNMAFFCKRMKTVRVHQPSDDGIFHFLQYQRIPVEDFQRNLETDKNMYSLEPLIGFGAPQGNLAERNIDFDEDLPGFITPARLKVSNLYIGPGKNKTLLHYDEVHSLLIMVEGEKDFVLFPPHETRNLYPYSAFDVRSVIEQRVVDSKINPVDIDLDRFPKLRNAKGWQGTLRAGQALFIPAGTWHYIESEEPNIAVNYFWYHKKLRHWFARPLSDFSVKRVQLAGIQAARNVRDFLKGLRLPSGD